MNYPPHIVTPERIIVRASHRDGDRLDKVDRFLNLAYPGTILYSIYRATQHPYLEYFLAEEAGSILITVIATRGFLAWWCWKKLTVIFTPSKITIKNGLRSFTLNAQESYGFTSMPHQHRRYCKSRYLPFTHHVLIEHFSAGTVVIGNVFGELIAKQIVSKLQALQARIKTLELKEKTNM